MNSQKSSARKSERKSRKSQDPNVYVPLAAQIIDLDDDDLDEQQPQQTGKQT